MALVSAPGGRDLSHVLYFLGSAFASFAVCLFDRSRQFRMDQQRQIQRRKLRQRLSQIGFV